MSDDKKTILVRDVMSDKFVILDGMKTVREAIDKILEDNARCIVVDKNHDGDEYGLVLLSDIVKKVIALNRSYDRTNIYEIMNKPIISVHPEMDVRLTSQLFQRFGLGLAPVTEDHKIIGVISYSQIVLKGFF